MHLLTRLYGICKGSVKIAGPVAWLETEHSTQTRGSFKSHLEFLGGAHEMMRVSAGTYDIQPNAF